MKRLAFLLALASVSNSGPSDNVPAPSSKRKAWQGRALGILLNPAHFPVR